MQTALLFLTAEFTTEAWMASGAPVLRGLAADKGMRVYAEAMVPPAADQLNRTLRDVCRQGCQLILLLGADGFPGILAEALSCLPHAVLKDGGVFELDGALLVVIAEAAAQDDAWALISAGLGTVGLDRT